GITRIYSPDDGRQMGLEGMIEHLLQTCCEGEGLKQPLNGELKDLNPKQWKTIAQAITIAEEGGFSGIKDLLPKVEQGAAVPPSGGKGVVPILGITGTGGAGKSSVTDEIVR